MVALKAVHRELEHLGIHRAVKNYVVAADNISARAGDKSVKAVDEQRLEHSLVSSGAEVDLVSVFCAFLIASSAESGGTL